MLSFRICLLAALVGTHPQVAMAQLAPVPAPASVGAVECLTSAIVHEAGFEPQAGQEAVAEVVLNRLHNPAFPKTVCGVVFQGSTRRTGCQFSFTCDGSLRKLLPGSVVAAARAVAERALEGRLIQRVAGATHYHADYVSPYWAPSLVKVGAIGRHIFYRLPGAGSLSVFRPYLAKEQLPATLGGESARGSPVAAPAKPEPFSIWGLALSAQPTTGAQ